MQTELPVPAARLLGDDLKARYPDMTAVIASDFSGKLTLLCICGKNAVEKGVKAPDVLTGLSEYVGGGGGGRPDSATAGAKNPEKLSEAFAALPEIINRLIK